ncbi:uncharacterized protein LOC128855095 [Anastrepha ludens]|uniref:uncharacterized protein LOC128855095 n=1 Tax=Anastrepha ludens TaxID=28586 RepID=UPI0023B1AF21|nr:uncharacterized protein LOC128855095 [Anastrepha ludens]
MIHKLLSNVRPGVLEKITTTETGIIACIWFPIPFVGDFNTQMMALRLLVMFLKCVDSKSFQNELDKIRGVPKSFMKNEPTAAISVGNFHTAEFEKIDDISSHMMRQLPLADGLIGRYSLGPKA